MVAALLGAAVGGVVGRDAVVAVGAGAAAVDVAAAGVALINEEMEIEYSARTIL